MTRGSTAAPRAGRTPSLTHAARSRPVGYLGRIGLASQGVCFVVIAVLALALAAGLGGEATDPQGALEALARRGWTEVLLILIAIGFGCYALWRFAQALLDRGRMGDDPGGLGRRGIQLVQGLVYTGLTISAVRIVAGEHPSRSGAKHAAAGVLGWPGGRELVAALGVSLAVIGVVNGYWGLSGRFKESMHTEQMSSGTERVVSTLGLAGFVSLTVVFAIVGWFLVKAAVQFDPHDAVSLGGALSRLAALDYGKVLLAVVALGLLAYGLFGLVQARYHRA